MSRQKKDPLRKLTEEERNWLERISRSAVEPASHVARAKQILAVADGYNYTEAAQKSGRESGDAVSHLVSRFNQEGMNAILPRHGGGPAIKYGVAERERILQEARRKPTPEADGTANWSLSSCVRLCVKRRMVCQTSVRIRSAQCCWRRASVGKTRVVGVRPVRRCASVSVAK